MNLLSALRRRSQRRRTYADLLQLDDHLLRDIGVHRGDLHHVLAGRTMARATHE